MTDPRNIIASRATAVLTALMGDDESLARTVLEDFDLEETRDILVAIVAIYQGAFGRVSEEIDFDLERFWTEFLKGFGTRVAE